MKTSLDHLPENRRARIEAMVATIRAEAPAAGMLVLFGSHARHDWVSDSKTRSGRRSQPRELRVE